jgi:hypothetical protein
MFDILQSALEKIKDANNRHKKFILTLVNIITICQGKALLKHE